MGVPGIEAIRNILIRPLLTSIALFRWLSKKYPKIISPVIEDQPSNVDGEEVPVDTTKANPNGEEFDNLYLDMNGIVHPCSHPEDRPPPANEEEMMLAVFEYTDRVVNMVRPRKLLLIAVGMSTIPGVLDEWPLANLCRFSSHAISRLGFYFIAHKPQRNVLTLIAIYRWCRPSRKDEPTTLASFPLCAGGQREG